MTEFSDDQPVGQPLPDWKPVPAPAARVLEGRFARLEPLAASHAEDLFRTWGEAGDERAWTYLGYDRPRSLEAARAWIADMTSRDLFFAILSRETGEALGVSSYIRVDRANGVIEIAHLHFGPRLKRTRIATEAIFLMMAYVFDDLGYRRVEWKCDHLNAPSRAAAVRFGFTFEGIFRQAMIYKGRNRDTAWYAVIDRDWLALKRAFEAFLADENFDHEGRARVRLSALTTALSTP